MTKRRLFAVVLATLLVGSSCTSDDESDGTDAFDGSSAATTDSDSSDAAASNSITTIEVVEPEKPDSPDAELTGSEQPVASEPLSGYIAVSVGTAHACAITVAGETECWGDRNDGRTEAPPGTYTALSAGNRHSCAIDAEGGVTCWGRYTLHHPADRGNAPFVPIDVGEDRSCAVSTSGYVECWHSETGSSSLSVTTSPLEQLRQRHLLDSRRGSDQLAQAAGAAVGIRLDG